MSAEHRVGEAVEGDFLLALRDDAFGKGSSGNIRIEYHTIGLFLDFRCLRSLLPPFG